MRYGKNRFVAAFLLGPVVLYAVFVVWPYVQTFFYSLTDWRGYSGNTPFVGLRNYRRVFEDEIFWQSLKHNAFFLVVVPLATILLALFFAFMLNVGGRADRSGVRGVAGSGLYKIILFLPQVLSVAIIAVLWQQIYRTDNEGLLNRGLAALGLADPDHPVLWTSDPKLVLWCIVFVWIWWGVGFYMVLFSAAMQSIPRDIYEAVLLDGANRSTTFFKITLPLLWDNIQVAWVYIGIAALDMFTFVYIMTPEQGGPNHASEVLGTWIYYNAFARSQPGLASAMAVLMSIFAVVLAVVSLRLSRREQIELG